MTDTAVQPICRFPDCYEPVHAEHVCREHYEQFHGPVDAAAEWPAPTLSDAPAPVPAGRLQLSPMRAVVRVDAEGVLGVYGAYGTGALAESAAQKLSDLGITGSMQVVPFYEVTP